MSNQEIVAKYSKIRQGIPEGSKASTFVADSIESITDISAVQAASALSLDSSESLLKPLFKMSDAFTRKINPLLDPYDGQFLSSNIQEVKKIVEKEPHNFDLEYLPLFLKEAGLSDSGKDSVGVLHAVGFNFLVDFVKERIPEIVSPDTVWKDEQVIALATKATNGYGEYQQRTLAKLNQTLQNKEPLGKSDNQIVISSLYLANYMWQVAKVFQYASEMSKKGAQSTRLTQTDFASFDDMIQAVYIEHKNNGHTSLDSLLLTAFKLFQDLAEYLQVPESTPASVA